jgi:hypothetical protein
MEKFGNEKLCEHAIEMVRKALNEDGSLDKPQLLEVLRSLYAKLQTK